MPLLILLYSKVHDTNQQLKWASASISLFVCISGDVLYDRQKHQGIPYKPYKILILLMKK